VTGRYKIKTVAERSGFSATLLRAWERRYDFLQPERQPSGHRLYSDEDLRVLRSVKLLLDRGQSVGEVATMGREALLRMTLPPGTVDGLGDRSTSLERPASGSLFPEKKDKLVKALSDLDAGSARSIVKEFFKSDLPTEEIQRFVISASEEIGRLWAAGKVSVASEHMLSSLWKEQIHLLIEKAASDEPSGKTFLCAGFPDELHDLGLLFLKYELVAAGHEVVYLGTALPFEDLDAGVRRLRPHVVCMSVTRVPVLQMHLPRLSEVVRRHPSTRFVVGGGGVPGMEAALERAGVVPWSCGRKLTELSEAVFI
jgi:DNA-binding transcriptional MerR regulator